MESITTNMTGSLYLLANRSEISTRWWRYTYMQIR